MSFECKSLIWKQISENINKTFGIHKFKIEIFSDGSGAIIELNEMYRELQQVFVFDNVEQIITKFLTQNVD